MTRFAFVFALTAAIALGADITGNWTATAEGPNGTIERTFVFKVDGNKLTGETTSSFLGKSVIEEGKIEGDTFSFTITARFQDNDMKFSYKGKVSGDGKELKMTSSNPNLGQAIEWTAKRSQ